MRFVCPCFCLRIQTPNQSALHTVDKVSLVTSS